jgi:hypothetical protein
MFGFGEGDQGASMAMTLASMSTALENDAASGKRCLGIRHPKQIWIAEVMLQLCYH